MAVLRYYWILILSILILFSCSKTKKDKKEEINQAYTNLLTGKTFYERHDCLGFDLQVHVCHNSYQFKENGEYIETTNDVMNVSSWNLRWKVVKDSLLITEGLTGDKDSGYKINTLNDSILILEQNYSKTNNKDSVLVLTLKNYKW